MSKATVTYLKTVEIPFTVYKYEIESRTYKYRYSIALIGKRCYFIMNHTMEIESFINLDTYDPSKYSEPTNFVFAHHRATVTEERAEG
jgi:hypothetical protein